MIKSLRRKFIAISMASVIIVLFLIMLFINTANYREISASANAKIDILTENNGEFAPIPLEFKRTQKEFLHPLRERNPITAETPFDTRYFTVSFDENAIAVASNTRNIALISPENATSIANELLSANKLSGRYDNFRYKAVTITNDSDCTEELMYIFVDCTREYNSFYSFLKLSILTSLIAIIGIFVLVLLFSKLVFKPVEESYIKQKQFITDASHELKTPLAIIDANAEVLELENGESEWLTSIRKQTGRLSSLTDKLVFLSRMDEGNSSLQIADFDLSATSYEIADSFRGVAESKNKQYSVNIEEGIHMDGDEAKIRQMLSLLIDNALKYSDDKGYIALSVKNTGKHKHITVENSVEKIEPGDQALLFERFYRADKSRNSKTGGHGIGLSVVHAIVTSHKGKVSAFSPDENTFRIEIIL